MEDLEHRIDTMLDRRPELAVRRHRLRALEVTEENVRRVFGLSFEELFRVLAAKLGYQIEDAPPPTTEETPPETG